MKASINIHIQEVDAGDLQRVLQALQGCTTSLTVTDAPAADAPVTTDPAKAPQGGAPTAPPAARRGRPKKNPDAEAPAADAASDGVAEANDAPAADAPKITENDVKQAVTDAIKVKGIDAVRKVISSFKKDDGKPAAKLSDLREADYAAVVTALGAA